MGPDHPPEQIISSLPQAVAVMLDPADCGSAFIGLCQDTQEIAFEYPEAFFEFTLLRIPRQRTDLASVADEVELLKSAKKELIISGGSVRYSGAKTVLMDVAESRGIPISETAVGQGRMT